MGTVDSCAQVVQTPTAGLVRSHLSTLSLRFDMVNVTLTNYRNADALDGVLGAVGNTLLCPRCVPETFDIFEHFPACPIPRDHCTHEKHSIAESMQW